jgi:dihydrofolate reductase
MGDRDMPRKRQARQDKKTEQPTRRVRYQVAVSLDGFIAGPNGEYDWIIQDPEIKFKEIYSQYDTLLIGRRTFDMMKSAGWDGSWPGMHIFVFSRTLRQKDHPGVIMARNPEAVVADLRSKPGKDIWLFGGGSLFRSLVERRLVDTVELGVIPVLLGEGIPLLPAPTKCVSLKLIGHRLYTKTGIMSLQYGVQYGQASKRRGS